MGEKSFGLFKRFGRGAYKEQSIFEKKSDAFGEEHSETGKVKRSTLNGVLPDKLLSKNIFGRRKEFSLCTIVFLAVVIMLYLIIAFLISLFVAKTEPYEENINDYAKKSQNILSVVKSYTINDIALHELTEKSKKGFGKLKKEVKKVMIHLLEDYFPLNDFYYSGTKSASRKEDKYEPIAENKSMTHFLQNREKTLYSDIVLRLGERHTKDLTNDYPNDYTSDLAKRTETFLFLENVRLTNTSHNSAKSLTKSSLNPTKSFTKSSLSSSNKSTNPYQVPKTKLPGFKNGLSKVTFECAKESGEMFNVPLAMIFVIMDTEGGKVGSYRVNKNGSRDLGPMQINTLWLPKLKALGINEKNLRDNGCLNVAVASWILRSHLKNAKNDPLIAVSYYHSKTPSRRKIYLKEVLKRSKTLDVAKTLKKANSRVS
jgi:hypothetical protein